MTVITKQNHISV